MGRVWAGSAARVVLARAPGLAVDAAAAVARLDEQRDGARAGYEEARAEAVREELAWLPVARLRDGIEGQLRLGPLEAVGYTTVGSLVGARVGRLQVIAGVGPDTAAQVVGAAYALRRALERTVRVRFDVDARPATQTRLLGALRRFEEAEQAIGPVRDGLAALPGRVGALVPAAEPAGRLLRMLFAPPSRRRPARAALDELHALVTTADTDPAWQRAFALSPDGDAAADVAEGDESVWDDYRERTVAYNGLLIAIAGRDGEPDAVHGHIPRAIAERIDTHELDTSLLTVSLRGYQAFGARFALSQGRAILGDEMGLGKTVEALAAMSHLHAGGATHSMVVCPASVLANWAHEIEQHSRLRAFRLHGPDRPAQLAAWAREGGVGVVTYDSLKSLAVPDDLPVALLVADEAHYVKNPSAQRTRTALRLIRAVDRVLLLTGTPVENRLEEFRSLVDHIRPDRAARMEPQVGLVGADAFRAAIVDEAAGNGWKTVVFSSFLDVLRSVEQALGDRCVGLLTGRLDPSARQALVDELTAAKEPLVLVSQIQAGGVGLNIQAASVVVLAEPQWKPSIEDQAVARLHRLGQARPVHVHRLLTEDGVDQRMREILAAKRQVFDEYVRTSDLKDASPHATDVRALATAPQAQAGRHIVDLERRRLGLPAADGGA